ncbi:MAG: 50S ribosomal protein L18 [Chitinophagaceae bacterium]
MDTKVIRRQKLKWRIRSKISGTPECPRLSVFRSNKGISAQLIDDTKGITLASSSTNSKTFSTKGNKVDQSKAVGLMLAEIAKTKNIEKCVFDRGGYLYHGRVKALAEGAREGGLKF